ncbi:hypothetical protein VTK73DRAFT_6893 [Phialemonium thermophilum]|uniref:Uncharacterized protein n=1 Tax=Phialemonium thermophilum TaxID=223376 RepID=A0ABR3WHY8_9PEZI
MAQLCLSRWGLYILLPSTTDSNERGTCYGIVGVFAWPSMTNPHGLVCDYTDGGQTTEQVVPWMGYGNQQDYLDRRARYTFYLCFLDDTTQKQSSAKLEEGAGQGVRPPSTTEKGQVVSDGDDGAVRFGPTRATGPGCPLSHGDHPLLNRSVLSRFYQHGLFSVFETKMDGYKLVSLLCRLVDLSARNAALVIACYSPSRPPT